MNIPTFNLFPTSEANKPVTIATTHNYNEPLGQAVLVTLSVQACPLVLIIIIDVALTAANLRQNQNLTKRSLFIISYYYSINPAFLLLSIT